MSIIIMVERYHICLFGSWLLYILEFLSVDILLILLLIINYRFLIIKWRSKISLKIAQGSILVFRVHIDKWIMLRTAFPRILGLIWESSKSRKSMKHRHPITNENIIYPTSWQIPNPHKLVCSGIEEITNQGQVVENFLKIIWIVLMKRISRVLELMPMMMLSRKFKSRAKTQILSMNQVKSRGIKPMLMSREILIIMTIKGLIDFKVISNMSIGKLWPK